MCHIIFFLVIIKISIPSLHRELQDWSVNCKRIYMFSLVILLPDLSLVLERDTKPVQREEWMRMGGGINASLQPGSERCWRDLFTMENHGA